MDCGLREKIVRLLVTRGWSIEELAMMPDSSLKFSATERLNDVDSDISGLKAAGLWPMPVWMQKGCVKLHGEASSAVQMILAMSEFDAATVYAAR